MNYAKIMKLQRDYKIDSLQKSIFDGSVWKMEGSAGRHAMAMLDIGVCMLPKRPHLDYYGNKVPSRYVLKKGTKGTFQNCVRFWSNESLVEQMFSSQQCE